MLVVRSVQEEDLDQLFDLVQRSEIGLTTLSISRDEMESRIEKSIFALKQKSTKPAGQAYVFVMQDLEKDLIVGTTAIYAKVGGFEPFYTYEIRERVHESAELGVCKRVRALHLVEEHDGPSEIGSLFLSPDYWGQGLGRTLSLSRFLFMARFPERFETTTIAEMRGVVSSDGKSPLWSALGSHFFDIDYPKAETMTSKSKKFIADLMPRHPIYIPLLPASAQEVIGKVHQNTRPAMAVLESEGFRFNDHVDIFDGGPTLECRTEEIRTVRVARQGIVKAIADAASDGAQQLISNGSIQYRACRGYIGWSDEGAQINSDVASMLQLGVGDSLMSAPLKPSSE